MSINQLSKNYNSTSYKDFNPIRENAFILNQEEKIKKITSYFKKILYTLGMDINDKNIKKTPKRVAKMFVQEIFSGLLPENLPKCSIFQNSYKYNEMLIEKNINFFSICEHHFLPIIGKAHVAYIPNKSIIGLSNINHIVNYYSHRPQVQERLTIQIVNQMKKCLNTKNVACLIDAKHLCVISRGVRAINSSTTTYKVTGLFESEKEIRQEFFNYINGIKK